MEFQKIVSLLNTTSVDKDLPRFVTKKWVEVCDQSGGQVNYNFNKEIRIKTTMLRLDLRRYTDAYIVVKGNITVANDFMNLAENRKLVSATTSNTANDAALDKKLAFKNNAPFVNCIAKINGVIIDDTEDLDVVMPMYNLLEYSKNYRKTTGSLWNYCRDEPNSGAEGNIKYSLNDSKSFDYHANIVGSVTAANLTKESVKIVIPLKHLSNFGRTLNIPLINCEIELILTWSKNCVLISKVTRDGNYTADPILPKIDTPTAATFQITYTKLYVPIVTLSTENDKKLLEQLKSGFKRTVKWNKYRSQMTVQNNNNTLNYLTDPTFTKINRLFVLSFARNAVGDRRDSFSHYYVPNVEIKDFNVLIDGKSFFDLSLKNEE